MNVNLTMFSEEIWRRKIDTGIILNYCGNRKLTLNDYIVFNLMFQFVNQVAEHSFRNFKHYCENIIIKEVTIKIAQATKDQAKLWHSMRQRRVTGSSIYKAIHCKTDNCALVQSILSGYKIPETNAITRSRQV